MNTRFDRWVVCVGTSLALLTLCWTLDAAETGPKVGKRNPNSKPPISVNAISMEVNALQALHSMALDKRQLEKILAWAENVQAKEGARKQAKVSKEFLEKLLALRKSLRESKDDDRLAELADELNELQEKEKPMLDDRVAITDEARKLATEAYRLLKPAQIIAYLSNVGDGVQDPATRLREAAEEVRALNDEEWNEQQNQIAADVGAVAAGLSMEKGKKLAEQALTVLTKVRALSKTEFEKQKDEIEEQGRKIFGDASAEVVIRNRIEVDLATLLSNPRLVAACKAMLKGNASVEPPLTKE